MADHSRRPAARRASVPAGRPRAKTDSDAWFWTPEWQEGEREADEEIAAGRLSSSTNVEELVASLKH